MTLVAPYRDPQSYDCPIVAGQRWPGAARVSGCERTYEWQINKGKGKSGATTNYQGEGLAEPEITFVLWEGYDGESRCDYFAEWERYKVVFDIPDQGDPPALPIEHPQFALAKIGPCSVKKVGDLQFQADGSATVTVKLLQFKPPKKSGGTPKAASRKVINQLRPKTAIELKLEERTNHLATLMKETSS